jgi:hypothetical protein
MNRPSRQHQGQGDQEKLGVRTMPAVARSILRAALACRVSIPRPVPGGGFLINWATGQANDDKDQPSQIKVSMTPRRRIRGAATLVKMIPPNREPTQCSR